VKGEICQGRVLWERSIISLGGIIIGGEKTICLVCLFFWCWEFGFGVFENHYRGH
jgi:hypothetical protein